MGHQVVAHRVSRVNAVAGDPGTSRSKLSRAPHAGGPAGPRAPFRHRCSSRAAPRRAAPPKKEATTGRRETSRPALPLDTAIPIDFRAEAPAPVANSKGITPRLKAKALAGPAQGPARRFRCRCGAQRLRRFCRQNAGVTHAGRRHGQGRSICVPRDCRSCEGNPELSRGLSSPEISSDGWNCYPGAIEDAFDIDVTYGQIEKYYGLQVRVVDAARCYSPAGSSGKQAPASRAPVPYLDVLCRAAKPYASDAARHPTSAPIRTICDR